MPALRLALLLAVGFAVASPPVYGPYNVSDKSYNVSAIDHTDPTVWLVYPVCSDPSCASKKFPLISYMHGLAGGDIDLLGYTEFFWQLASYGFIIAAPDACDFGCTDPSLGAPWTDCAGLPDVQPAMWPAYYGEGLKAIDWARNMSASASSDAVFQTIDWHAGVGIAGHSMGGQAATIAASAACTARWGIKAAVLHHPASGATPAGNVGVNISVPVIGMTSDGDSIWPETQAIMAAFNGSSAAAQLPSAYRDLAGWSHLEPVLAPPIENPLLATYTAAWFKVFLNGDRGTWYDFIFGSGPDALCNYANMTACYILNAP